MPVHEWTRVEPGIYHGFHTAWIIELRNALNGGVLPKEYYALAEQHAGRRIADILTLHGGTPPAFEQGPSISGGLAVAEAPPKARRKISVAASIRKLRRTLAIRHISGHSLIALIEIISPANKDRPAHVEEFAQKVAAALDHGVHVLLVDVFPPGNHDPHGMHGAVWQMLDDVADENVIPPAEPVTLASYVANSPIEAYLEHVAVGKPLPNMPLFLQSDRYVNVPLETTYQAGYKGMPAYWRAILEKPAP